MYERITKEKLIETIEGGYFPTWFTIDGHTLQVDMCCNYRLQDGKVYFAQCTLEDLNELKKLAKKVAKKATDMWSKEMQKLADRIPESIKEVKKLEKRLSKIKLTVGHIYAIGCPNTKEEDYVVFKCTSIEENEIYIEKLIEEKYARISLFWEKPESLSNIIDADSVIIDKGHQLERRYL